MFAKLLAPFRAFRLLWSYPRCGGSKSAKRWYNTPAEKCIAMARFRLPVCRRFLLAILCASSSFEVANSAYHTHRPTRFQGLLSRRARILLPDLRKRTLVLSSRAPSRLDGKLAPLPFGHVGHCRAVSGWPVVCCYLLHIYLHIHTSCPYPRTPHRL